MLFPKKIDYSIRDIKSYYTNRNNGRLVVFGDSFAETSTRKDPDETCWVFILAEMMGCSILNYARGGSSLQYSKQMLFEYMETEYNEDDYIIFISTSYTRVPTMPEQMDPGWAASINNYFLGDLRNIDKNIQHRFYSSNHNAMEYIATNITTIQDFNNDLCLIDIYLKSLKNRCCLIPAFNHGNSLPDIDVENFDLFTASIAEDSYDDETSIKDTRICHFSTENNKILAGMFYKYFETNSYEYFKMRKFKK